MVVMITNSGSDKKTVCGQYHDLGVRICAGIEDDDSFLPSSVRSMMATIHSKTKAAWAKVNPSLDHIGRGPGRPASRVASTCESR